MYKIMYVIQFLTTYPLLDMLIFANLETTWKELTGLQAQVKDWGAYLK